MTEVSVRHIRTRFGPQQVPELLQSVFAAELVSPSRCIWIISPWISDVPVLENRANAFTTFAGDWARARVRLAAMLGWLVRHGTTVHVASRPTDANEEFFRDVTRQTGGQVARLRVHRTDELHEKGILGDGYYLSGSMNITHMGITINEEVVHFFTDAATVASTRHVLMQRWGGSVQP